MFLIIFIVKRVKIYDVSSIFALSPRISFIWCEMCFVMLLETKPKIR